MKKRRSFSPDYQEDYLLNNSEFQPGWSGIRVHSFCHSLLLPNFTPDQYKRPFILVSLILSGGENFVDSDGDRIVRKPGFFSIIDLNQNKAPIYRRRQSLERYFVLFHVNRFLRGMLDDLFPSGLFALLVLGLRATLTRTSLTALEVVVAERSSLFLFLLLLVPVVVVLRLLAQLLYATVCEVDDEHDDNGDGNEAEDNGTNDEFDHVKQAFEWIVLL